ncbi:hypothetical protein F0P96_10580 [Hymenobacter busanensis]|uniref:Uncharacterized protein n=1 Tax=Hymenobacter busanensis TaxID=2607656 RepID=A0A7L4ZWQ0_9BACT|nr:hypothetical protein [Hymenobacter busanensis]KAA9333406.1 hypothetical protein F0P96_10580 [Hymenobacter busanensis]QHJ07914.1 hypothetical protein GUY19_11725 [Hymenobacter busanensis]
MNEALADYLAARVYSLPFVERSVGLARTYEHQLQNGDDWRTVRLPVPVSFTAAECEQNPRYLVPDASTASIFFLEDYGATPAVIAPGIKGWESRLRLIGLINPAGLVGELHETDLLASLLAVLGDGKTVRYLGPFLDVRLRATVLPADASLVSRYTYDTPMLYPPYRLVGLELTVRYRLARACTPADLPTLINPKPAPEPAGFTGVLEFALS